MDKEKANIEIESFCKLSLERGICDKYKDRLKTTIGKQNTINLLSELQPAKYYIESVEMGIAPSTDAIVSVFGQYINGKYRSKRDNSDITIEWYFGVRNEIVKTDATYVYMCDCDCIVDRDIDNTQIYHVFGKSNVQFNRNGDNARVYCYNDSITTILSGKRLEKHIKL